MIQNTPFFVDNEMITLTKNGVWIADGVEISHEPTRRLFAKSLKKDPDKGYFLHIGRETKLIEVEDTAYFIHRIDGSPVNGYLLWINDETQEKLDPTTLRYKQGRLTCLVHAGKEEAKFLQSAYMDLLKNLKQDLNSYYLEIGPTEKPFRIELEQIPSSS